MHRNLQEEIGPSKGHAISPPAPAQVNFHFDREMLREVVEEIMRETFAMLDWPAGRIALTEEEAAEACGVKRHVLRDLRLAGKINATKIGRKIVYTRDDVVAALNAQRTQQTR